MHQVKLKMSWRLSQFVEWNLIPVIPLEDLLISAIQWCRRWSGGCCIANMTTPIVRWNETVTESFSINWKSRLMSAKAFSTVQFWENSKSYLWVLQEKKVSGQRLLIYCPELSVDKRNLLGSGKSSQFCPELTSSSARSCGLEINPRHK